MLETKIRNVIDRLKKEFLAEKYTTLHHII